MKGVATYFFRPVRQLAMTVYFLAALFGARVDDELLLVGGNIEGIELVESGLRRNLEQQAGLADCEIIALRFDFSLHDTAEILPSG